MQAARRILVVFLLLTFLYSLLRVLFWQVNYAQFQDLPLSELLGGFGRGLRFDLAATALTNAAVFLLYLAPLPISWKNRQRIATIWAFTLINGFFISINIVDIEYYRFTGKRWTLDSFQIANDMTAQIPQLTLYYWPFVLSIFAAFFGLFFLAQRVLNYRQKDKLGPRLASSLIIILGLSLASRGGWQFKPLIPAHAYAGDSAKLGILVLNSSFTLLKSSTSSSLEPLAYMPEIAAKEILNAHMNGPIRAIVNKPKNLVLVILESFSHEYVFPPAQHKSYAPFLQELAHRGSSFNHAFANGRRSIDALPAILAGIPAWMETPFITSSFQTNTITGLPTLLKNQGLKTQFFHGGENGTMFFDVMANRLGFAEFIGAKEYPDPADHDGRWGIFDQPFLRFTIDRLSQNQTPFFAGIFTLSSHQPYTIPPQLSERFPKGKLEIHESIGYSDFALQEFYSYAQKQGWFKDTLFIFTADHTQKSEFAEYQTSLGRYRVPLIFIQNDQPLPFPNLDRPAQHADILTTVMDIFGLAVTEHSRFGSSLLRDEERPGIVLYEAPRFLLVGDQKLLDWNPTDGSILNFNWRQDPLLQSALPEPPSLSSQLFIQAQAQCFNNGMLKNRLIW